MDLDLVGQIRNQRTIPTLPPIALDVVQLCGRDDVALEDLGRAVMRDPALTSRLLRIANSAAFGRPRQIASVPQAISLLGLRTVRVVALASALIDNVEHRRIPGFDYEGFWRNSVAAALASRSFSEISSKPHPDEAFVVGLLQDLGLYGLADALMDRYLELLQTAQEQGQELALLEEERLGVNHADISSALLESWGFPERIVEAVRRHTRPSPLLPPPTEADEIANAAHLGELAAATFRRPTAAVLEALTRKARERLGLDETQVAEVLLYVHRNVEETSRALNLNVGTADELRLIRRRIEEILTGESKPEAPTEGSSGKEEDFSEIAARVDPVTGLLNRGAIEREMLRCLEDSSSSAEGFAAIVFSVGAAEKRAGEEIPDELLKGVTHVLKVSLPPSSRIGRYAPDAFLLVVPDVSDGTARDLADRVMRNVGATASLAKDGCSRALLHAGISWVGPGDEKLATEILREATHALSWARQTGPNKIVMSRPLHGSEEEEEKVEKEEPEVGAEGGMEEQPEEGEKPAEAPV
ncbi:MAG TPA: HDOD domain-containing protein [Planctomycetota bacterium]|jgi:diguanylate cyclase (GGDEF)-like protein|nr:HDOD domain-containing protein [Planctomycetota bacterium]